MSLGWSLAAVPGLIGLNAFFVTAEYAVVALRPAQVEALRGRGNGRTADAITALKANPASAIGTIQVCITMTNLALGAVGEPAMTAVLTWAFGPVVRLNPAVFLPVAVALSFVVVTLLTVVFSELMPKALTLRFAEPAAVLTAVPTIGIQKVVRPLVWVMNAMANAVTKPLGLGSVEQMEETRVTLDELRLMAAQAADQGSLSPRERSLVLNSLALGRRRANQIMVPRVRVAYLDLRWTMDENRRVMNEQLYSRLPLCDGGMDHVTGVVHIKEFMAAFYAEGDVKVLSLIARPAVFVPESVSLDRLMGILHDKRTQLALLVDEYGGIEGIVTLKDVVDELVGQIEEDWPPPGMPPRA